MRTAARSKNKRGQVSRTVSVPAPVGGLNRRDPIAAMDTKYAYTMNNFFPGTTSVDLRQGYSKTATGLPGAVNTLMTYNLQNGTQQMFGASVAGIYNVTNSGAVGAAVVSGLTSDKFQHINWGNASNVQYLYAVNGADKPLLYDGTTWTPIDGASTPSITGVTTSTLININIFKNRIWFIQKNTMNAWYLPTLSLGGAASQFSLAQLFKKGGYLVSMGVITFDGGNGSDDYCVFITSEGEAAMYRGTDPASINTFALVGVFQLSGPIGYRSLAQYKGDLLIISREGLLPFSQSLLASPTQSNEDLTDNIRPLITADTMTFGNVFGWQVQLYPQQNMLILNVPVAGGRQYVMNTITGAWASFSGWSANCFERMGNDVYFGSNGYIAKIWGTTSDDGANIQGDALQAFDYFGSHSQLKHFRMMRPTLLSNGIPGVKISINVDFNTDPPAGSPGFSASSGATWDVSKWDQAVWAADSAVLKDWQYGGAIGYSAALYLRGLTRNQSLSWVATDFVFESGGVL